MMPAFRFQLQAVCAKTLARAGRFDTPHGPIDTPAFMPVGTQGTVKALLPADVRATGAQCVLANTYHLAQRPGAEIIARLGGLHRFTGWRGPMLTDSGGFQVFSLDELRTLDDDGVTFRSHLDGRELRLTPERALELQEHLGADIVMQLDECTPYPCSYATAAAAVERTQRWAERSARAQQRTDQALFGIVQGGMFPDLRERSARGLASLDLPGYAIGGLSVGEPKEVTMAVLAETTPLLPLDRPRYLMGVGAPQDLVRAIGLGVDLFDCVLPTRLARNGAVFRRGGRLSLSRAELLTAEGPIDATCACPVCTTHSLGYLASLHREREPLAARLASIHNVSALVQLVQEARAAIMNGTFADWQAERLRTLAPARSLVE
jgi:queuine tRNA-ribosyltransferase